MAATFYIRLIALSAGALVYLFLIALILGHRRPRKFERLLFFLVLSLFLIYAGGLLEINAQIQYVSQPDATRLFYQALIALGALFLAPLVAFSHAEYVQQVHGVPARAWVMWLAYVLCLAPAGSVLRALVETHARPGLGVAAFLDSLLRGSGFILAASAIIAALLQLNILMSSRAGADRRVLRALLLATSATSVILTIHEATARSAEWGDGIGTAAAVCGVIPGAVLVYYSLRHNFLEFGAQRNLVYALSASFLALLYLAFVRRLSGWLEPVLPPEATASILLFVLIFLFEPLERAIGPALDRRFRERVGRMQKLASEMQQQARQGNLEQFQREAERRIREEFGLAAVRVSIPRDAGVSPLAAPGGLGHAVAIPLRKGREEIGLLEAASTGAYLTGETSAALDFLAEQLPAMVELCRLIEEKLRLERELAERERLALLGQMAASVSHNLRNPLSSMKTVLQVQLENPDLPLDVRHDCALVVDEIDRMSAKLSQLLRFAKPSVNGQRIGAVAVARQIAALFGRDAERRNVRLEFSQPAEEISVVASEEAFSEALSNLIVNAIEAQPEGGRVRVALDRRAGHLEILVEDDGPGISAEARAKIFQPFYTTKTTGTGLGLAIVARRLAEIGGTLACESPVRNRKGTRFRVTLPLAESEAQ
ncbi:MAG TPA: ATP-binding protein [Candidatus Limnocylindrales bacterium]|nr:ATP-binding protein [Candidatus Limnocylindrales bacterium]